MCFNIPIMLFWYYVIKKKRKEVIKAGNKLCVKMSVFKGCCVSIVRYYCLPVYVNMVLKMNSSLCFFFCN